jgi:hypothetical protein
MTTHQTQSGVGRSIGEGHDGLLRLALKLDAAATAAVGVLSLATGPVLDGLLGTPLALLLPVGLFLLVYATLVWVVAARPRVNRTAVWAVITVNLLYAVDCVVIVATEWFSLTGLGVAFVLFQAAAVALFAAAQLYALRRMGRAR